MSGIMCAAGIIGASGGGGGGGLDSEIVTVGEFIFGAEVWWTGYSSGTMGSISDGQFAPKGGATITGLYMDVLASMVYFQINGEHSNSGWSTMSIGGHNFSRASASFSAVSGFTRWSWSYSTIPFSGPGTNTTVAFT